MTGSPKTRTQKSRLNKQAHRRQTAARERARLRSQRAPRLAVEDEQGALRSITRLVSHTLTALPDSVMETFDIPDVEGALTLEQVGGFAILCQQILQAKLDSVERVIHTLQTEQGVTPPASPPSQES